MWILAATAEYRMEVSSGISGGFITGGFIIGAFIIGGFITAEVSS
jgi:hypothetical protein